MEPKIFAVATAHLDTQWTWNVRRTISEFLPMTLQKNFELMEKYENYRFNFEGAFRYELIREYFPRHFELLKQAVSLGKWVVSGNSYESTDVLIPSEEALIRNILYGQSFFREVLNTKSEDLFLPDCFGFSNHLVTIASHMGLKSFSTQKLQWNDASSVPIPFNIGKWMGRDGSFLYAALRPGIYETTFDMSLLGGPYREQALKEGLVVLYYGTGDEGGAPTEESVQVIEEDVKKGTDPEAEVQVISARSDEFYQDLYQKELPTYEGELLLKTHGVGTFTSRAILKKWNRLAERLAFYAEGVHAIASDFGYDYPRENLTNAWKRFLWHGFHDDLTGTSIPSAYRISKNDYLLSIGQFSDLMSAGVRSFSHLLDTESDGVSVVVFNPTGFPRLARISLEVPEGNFVIKNKAGEKLLTQLHGTELSFLDYLPSFGYKVYDLVQGTSEKSNDLSIKKDKEYILENDYYRITVTLEGKVRSIYDKEFSRELLRSPIRFEFFKDTSKTWPAWEILYEDLKEPKKVDLTLESIQIVEEGPVSVALEIVERYDTSVFKSTYRLIKDTKRIEVSFDIDWFMKATLLKVAFNLLIPGKASYDMGVGAIERPVNSETGYEVPAHDFVDLSDGNFGVSIFSKDKYGWDHPDEETIRLTLIHTPEGTYKDTHQDLQDLGKHHTELALFSHTEDYRRSTVRASSDYHYEPVAFYSDPHPGRFKEFSFIEVEDKNLRLLSVKRAEASNHLVVRVQEMAGEAHEEARIQFHSRVASVHEVNGMEELISQKSIMKGSTVAFHIGPYELKSLLVELKEQEPAEPIREKEIPLVYNYNLFSPEGSNKINAFLPIEVTPKTLLSGNVHFTLYPENLYSVMKCTGQKIFLPDDFEQLHFLAASLDGDRVVEFEVDGVKEKLVIGDFFEDIGGWEDLSTDSVSYLKEQRVAFYATHLHTPDGNIPYSFGYLFHYSLRGRKIKFPNNEKIIVFAATAASYYELESAKSPLTIKREPTYLLRVVGERDQYVRAGMDLRLLLGDGHFEPDVKVMPANDLTLERKEVRV
ncbi:alpha-mannosidase [Guggenheimella bovis]